MPGTKTWALTFSFLQHLSFLPFLLDLHSLLVPEDQVLSYLTIDIQKSHILTSFGVSKHPGIAVSCPSATLRTMASDQEAANALKLQGNKAFADHEWPTAVDFYTQAIEKYDKDPSYFSNRAQVRRPLTRLNVHFERLATAGWMLC